MKIITLLIFVTVTHAYPPGQILYSDNLSNSVDEVYDSYLSESDDDKDDVNPPPPDSILNNLIEEENANFINPDETQRVERTSIVHVQTREKNKRYSSYLTLCHFKICNMGRKRTTRYFQVMKTLDNKT